MEKDLKNYFLLRRYELIFKNAISYFNVVSSFKPMRKDLLELVRIAGTTSDITFLEKDTEASKKYLEKLKKIEPRLEDAIGEQLDWIEDVLLPAIKKQKRIIYKQSGKVFTESYLDMIVNEGIEKELVQPVFILLTYTGTMMAKIIKIVTGQPFSHVSISFDTSLENMYSFGRKDPTSPSGFIEKESYNDGLLGDVANRTTYALYSIFLTKSTITKMQTMIKKTPYKNMKFSFRGLLNVKLNKISEYGNEYFCSWFVASLLKLADETLIDRDPSLYSPFDLTFIPNIYFISNGILSRYDKKLTDKKIDELRFIE